MIIPENQLHCSLVMEERKKNKNKKRYFPCQQTVLSSHVNMEEKRPITVVFLMNTDSTHSLTTVWRVAQKVLKNKYTGKLKVNLHFLLSLQADRYHPCRKKPCILFSGVVNGFLPIFAYVKIKRGSLTDFRMTQLAGQFCHFCFNSFAHLRHETDFFMGWEFFTHTYYCNWYGLLCYLNQVWGSFVCLKFCAVDC